MSNLFQNKPNLTPVPTIPRPYSVTNFFKGSNKVFQPLEPNSFKMDKTNNFLSQKHKTQANIFHHTKKSSEIHPLEFYALGKVRSQKKYSILEWNKGIKSTANDIIERNYLSINAKKFNDMNNNKKLSNLKEQNINENNYMDPVKMYKTLEKYNIPKCATNPGIYKLMREKYFARDIHSTIAQGKQISKNEFIQQKEKIMKKGNLNLDNIDSNKDKEKDNNKKENKAINKSKSAKTGLIYRDPNDYSKKLLKGNYLYFDKNNEQMVKNRKWKYNEKG